MPKTFVLKSNLSAKDFKVDYQKELNDEQFKVVIEAEGPCLVLAGAGSGKTRTIVYRVAYLIERGVKPENILLVTFTNKAAKEMLFRVERLLGRFPEGLWGGTFHHIGNRILRKYAKLLGYGFNFTILDEEDSKNLIKVCLKEEDTGVKVRSFSASQPRYAERGRGGRPAFGWPSPAVIKDLLSYAKNSETELEEVISARHPKWLKISDQIKKIAFRYEQKKQLNNSMDFDDLLVNWLKLLKQHPEVKDRLSAQFHYILVDEYQDTNYLQAEIVKELSQVHHNVLVVGDDAQSIYSFRAADIGNILNFPKVFKGAKILKLETNYRSTPEILLVANQVIENNLEQFPKVLKPVLKNFVKPNVVRVMSGREEAQFIAEQILELSDEGMPLNKIAVLFRAAYHSQELEFELTKRDIFYEYRGGVRFFERAHIKDALAFLKVINNPADEVAWLRILNLQAGIGEATAAKIYQAVKGYKDISKIISLNLGGILTSKSEMGWHSLLNIFKSLKIENLKFNDPSVSLRAGNLKLKTCPEQSRGIENLIRDLAKSDYRNYLETEYPNFKERLDDLEQLALFSERYEDLSSFLSEVSLQESFGVDKAGLNGYENKEKLVLSTIHQAKGLEWEAVFIINLVDTAFPNQRAIAEEGGLEEERRLFYVAITRAKKQLFLTYPLTGSHASMHLNAPSQFLTEINEELLEEIKLIDPAELGKENIWNRKDLNDGPIQYLPDINSL